MNHVSIINFCQSSQATPSFFHISVFENAAISPELATTRGILISSIYDWISFDKSLNFLPAQCTLVPSFSINTNDLLSNVNLFSKNGIIDSFKRFCPSIMKNSVPFDIRSLIYSRTPFQASFSSSTVSSYLSSALFKIKSAGTRTKLSRTDEPFTNEWIYSLALA